MSDRTYPRPYHKGVRKQMTPAWKQRVLDVLRDNANNQREPSNLAELARAINADKRGIYVMFDLEANPPQTSSTYVDDICELLQIEEPLQPPPIENDELDKLINKIRSLPEDEQQRWIGIIKSILPPSD